MRVPIMFMVATLVVLIVGAVVASGAETGEHPAVDVSELSQDSGVADVESSGTADVVANQSELFGADVEPDPGFPSDDDLRLIERLSEGVLRVARYKGGGRWWRCGEVLTEAESVDHAAEWARRIVFLAKKYSDPDGDDGRILNPWGIFGVAANESGFDVCALGPWPRKWGYQHKTLRRRKMCISHPYSEIEATMRHPEGIRRWRTSGIDASPLHLLWQCNGETCAPKWAWERLPSLTLAEVFSLGKGFEYGVRQLRKYAIDFGTDRPWLYWPGRRSVRYDRKVMMWARKGGATNVEI